MGEAATRLERILNLVRRMSIDYTFSLLGLACGENPPRLRPPRRAMSTTKSTELLGTGSYKPTTTCVPSGKEKVIAWIAKIVAGCRDGRGDAPKRGGDCTELAADQSRTS